MNRRLSMISLAVIFAFLAASVVVAQETSTVTGKVISVKVKERTLTISGDKRGERKTFYVSQEARITKRGQAVGLRGLQAGDRVTLTVRGTSAGQNELPVVVALRAPEPKIEQAAPPVAPAPAPAAAQPAPAQPKPLPVSLPRTGSPLPLIGVVGAGLLALAGGLGWWRRRSSR